MKHLVCATLLCALAATAAAGAGARDWTAAWSAAPDSPGPALGAGTICQVVRPTIAGSGIRLRLSNLFGTDPLVIASVQVGVHAGGTRVQPGTGRAMRFAGARGVTIAAGASVLSDPLDMPVTALRELVVSLALPEPVAVPTLHGVGLQTASFTAPGQAADDSRYFLTGVDVMPVRAGQALVVVGDSIADGVGSGTDRNARWSDVLAERLQRASGLASIAVVNQGIAGNRIVRGASDPFIGPSAVSRFQRDALDMPGVHWILLHEGINDIAASHLTRRADDKVSRAQIIRGMRTLVARARTHRIRIWGGTLLPFEGSQLGDRAFYTAGAETQRQAINAWIRSAGRFDAVVDFDLALRDPAHPARLRPEFDSGDHLHPNRAGYRAMAQAIDLRMLGRDLNRHACSQACSPTKVFQAGPNARCKRILARPQTEAARRCP